MSPAWPKKSDFLALPFAKLAATWLAKFCCCSCLNKLLNLEVDEKIELESRILAKKSLKKAFEVTSIELSMIRPEKVVYLEVVNWNRLNFQF